jgi:peptidoglycan/LPS O-acetylase OafA/YrhL
MNLASIFTGCTLDERCESTKGRSSGFDYIRVILALGVICWHVRVTTYGDPDPAIQYDSLADFILLPFAIFILPMFFSLSGFLVAGSLERCKTFLMFLGLRALRIVPALAVAVLVSALVLGPLLTSLPLGAYFADPEFHAYFLNIVADTHYRLPGVFVSNPFPLVNGQLWTIPYELACYVALAILAATGIFQQRWWLFLSLMAFYVAQVLNTILRANDQMKGAGGSTLVMSFVAGLVIYRYRDRIPLSRRLFLLACVVSAALIVVPNGVRFSALPIAYVTVYLGLKNPRRSKIVLSGDYSYGLYVYGFLIQQALMAISPSLREWYWNLLLAIPCALMIAAGSWWLVERPALAQRNRLNQLEEWYLKTRANWRSTKLTPVTGLTPMHALRAVEGTEENADIRARRAEV